MMFVKLLLAHLLSDFLFQPNQWVVHKRANKIKSPYLYLHVLVYFTLNMLFLWDLKSWKLALILAFFHWIIDVIKIYTEPFFKNKTFPFLADQFLHVVVIYICVYYKELPEHFTQMVMHMDWPLITAYYFVTYPCAIIMGILLEPMSNQIATNHKSLSNAGKYIGMLERVLVLTFIILDHWEAIGLLIAAKSVFRFNDLKESNNRKLTEYILIGTLVSFGLAMATGILYLRFS